MIYLSSPWMLLPAVALLGVTVGLGRGRRRLGWVRLAEWVLLSAGMAGLGVGLARRQVQRVAVVDLSESYAPRLAEVDRRLQTFDRLDRAIYVGAIIRADGYPPGDDVWRAFDRPAARSSTRLADALSLLARTAEGPADALVFTDGRANAPVPDDTLDALRRTGVRLYPVALPMPSAEVGIVGLTHPEEAAPGSAFAVTVHLRWSGSTGCAAVLTGPSTQSTAVRQLPWPDDSQASRTTTVELVGRMPEAGPARYTVTLRPTDDAIAGNNTRQFTVWPGARRRLLIVAPAALGEAIEQTLSTLPGTVAVAAPPGGAAEALGQDYDAVVLAGLPHAELPADAIGRLTEAVRRRGVGLLALGGPRSFAAGGYTGTAVEELLPVRCDPPGRQIALGLVLDASSSMAGRIDAARTRFDAVRDAALAVVARLSPRDRLMLIAFAGRPTVLIEPGAAPSDRQVAARLAGVRPYGATDLVAALSRAAALLAKVDLPHRHLLVLSDGRSRTEDMDEILRTLRRERISVSVVASGDDHNRELLVRLAESTGGSFYDPESTDRLQATFLEDLRKRRGTLYDTDAQPWRPTAPPAADGPTPIVGLNPMQARDGSTVRAETDGGSPVLVTGRAELAATAALATDPFAPDNAALWRDARFVQLLTRTLEEVSARPADSRWIVRTRRDGDRLVVEAEAAEPTDRVHRLAARLSTDESTHTVTLDPTAPTRYRGTIDVRADTPADLVVLDDHRIVGRARIEPAATESAAWTLDRPTLERLAQATGGRVVEDDRIDSTLSGRKRIETVSLRPAALLALIALVLAEAALAMRQRQ